MNTPERRMRLSVFLYGNSNYHVAGWRHPDAATDMGSNLQTWIDVARKMERAKLDMLFVADSQGLPGGATVPAEVLARSGYGDGFEPFTLLGALAAVTSRIGLVLTSTTTYNAPFNIARMVASLDQLSGGRVGWNVVSGGTADDGYNFNRDGFVPHAERYAQAEEFVDVVTGLWDSFDEDAFVRDKRTGVYFRPEWMHHLNHEGKYFKVKGPICVPRSPQGRPVLVQAGKSEAGRALAARIADVIFTSQASLAEARAFYADVKERAAGMGRNPDEIRVMPGVSVYVGATDDEARRKRDELDALIDPETALARLSQLLGGIDLSAYSPDGPAPDFEANGMLVGAPPAYVRLAREDDLTLLQLARRASAGKDHLMLTGTPEQVVDVMEAWFRNGAADGFNLLPHTMPRALDDFLDQVVPELRRRGLFRAEYEGTTLRSHLAIPVPASRYA